jgi:N utilization substance protein B
LSRRTARKNAFLTLYQSDVTGKPMAEVLGRWRSYRGELEGYAERLALGVEGEKEDLDARLGEAAVGWSVHRMNAVDRTILRLALYEMLRVEDVPPEVAVSEAMELARGFSGEESPQFVGGVLRGARARMPEVAAHNDERPNGNGDDPEGEVPLDEDFESFDEPVDEALEGSLDERWAADG